MTHGCSPFAVTRRNLTALDIVTAHTIMPGREDVALLLEEAMRGDGWTGGRMEQKRKVLDERIKRKGKRKSMRDNVGKTLSVDQRWWGGDDSDSSSVDSDLDEEEENPELFYVSTTRPAELKIIPEGLYRHPRWISHRCSSSRPVHFPKFLIR